MLEACTGVRMVKIERNRNGLQIVVCQQEIKVNLLDNLVLNVQKSAIVVTVTNI